MATNMGSVATLARLSPLDCVGWLAGEPEPFRRWIAETGRWRTFAADQVIYQAGDAADGIYGLGSGSLLITFPLVAEEPVVIYRAEPGFWIGDAAELSKAPRMVTVSASTECRLFFVPSHAIHAQLAANPQHWRSFYRLSMLTMYTTVRLLSETLALTVRARVCRRLLDLAERSRTIEITQDQLANLLGVTRTTMRRCLSELVALGAIDLQYRRLIVLDDAVLRAFKDEQ